MARKGYVQLANGFYMNRKVRKLRATCPTSIGAFVILLSYCGDNLTDGYVDDETIQYVLQISDEELDALCDAGMLERREDGSGYAIHDYLNHNRSREQVLRERRRVNERYARNKAKNTVENHTGDETSPSSHQGFTAGESKVNPDKHQNTRTPEHHITSIPLPLSPKREKGKRKKKPDKTELPSDAWVTDHLLLQLPDGSDQIAARRHLYQLIRDGTPPDQAARQTIDHMTETP